MSLTVPPPRRGITPAVLAVVVLITSGAAIAATAAYYELRPAATGPAPPGSVVVVDDAGRTVTAPVNATRIVVLAPSIMDIVSRLGLRERVVGVGCTPQLVGGILDEYSPNQTAEWNLSSSMCVPDFPSLNTEAVANLTPGLVLAATITSAEDISTLTDTYHLPVVILAPTTLSGIVGDVNLVARLFPGALPRSVTLDAQMQGVLSNASAVAGELSANATPIPSVLLTYYFDPNGYYSYGPGTFGQSLVDLASGNSIAAGVPLQYAEINASVVLADQPQLVIYGTSWNDPYIVSNQTPNIWPSAPYWAQLNGTKIPVDVTLLDEPGPSMLLELPWFLHWFHPTLVPAPRT